CVQHDLKRINLRARSFKILCFTVCVSPSRNANEQQSGDSNGGPTSGLTYPVTPFPVKRRALIRIGRLSDVLRVHRIDLLIYSPYCSFESCSGGELTQMTVDALRSPSLRCDCRPLLEHEAIQRSRSWVNCSRGDNSAI